MNRAETLKIMSMFRAAYPKFYDGKCKQELENIVNLWQEMFDEPYEVVCAAVKTLIVSDEKGFPPVIGQVKQKIRLLTEPERLSEGEAWEMVTKALRNSTYNSKEEFDKLPPLVQKAVGGPAQLRELACMDSDTVQSVEASNFRKAFRTLEKRDAEFRAVPDDVKRLAQTFAGVFQPMEAPLQIAEPTQDEIQRFDRLKEMKLARLAEWKAKGITDGRTEEEKNDRGGTEREAESL